MNSEIIDRPAEVDADLGWCFDGEVSAHFCALYRRLLSHAAPAAPLRTLGVTSCRRGAGASTVAAQLAIAAAEDSEQRVLLIDAAPIETLAHRTYAIAQTPGFLDVVQGTHTAEEALTPSRLPNLWILPARAGFRRPSTTDPKTTAKELLAELSHDFALVVIDLPHVDQLGDAASLATALDGIVLVVDAEDTERAEVRAATAALSQFRLLGAVLNNCKHPDNHTHRQTQSSPG